MANDVMELDARITRLEDAVTSGFAEVKGEIGQVKGRMTSVEQTMSEMNNKLDIMAESLRGDIQTVLERVVGLTEELRRTTVSMRKEHEADRRIIHLTLRNHGTRIAVLESGRYSADDILNES